MYWKSTTSATFARTDVIQYAKMNGWVLVDSVRVTKDDLSAWSYNGKPMFPWSTLRSVTRATNDASHAKLPVWIESEQNVYMFRTKWVMIEPGTDEGSNVNGFVVVSAAGDEMAVYHVWGE